MKRNYYTQMSGRFIYSLFYSSKKKKNNRFRNHHHTETELSLMLKGSGSYVLNGKKFTVREGDLFIVRSNEQHCIPTITSDTLIAFNMHLSSYFLWNICSDYVPLYKIQALINSDIPINNRLSDSKIIMCFKNIARLTNTDSEDTVFEIRSEVLRAVRLIADKINTPENQSIPSAARLNDIQKAIDYIKHNYKRRISLDDIAKSAAMSRSYLSNTFKAVTGISPYNYLMTTRIEHAAELLKDREKTIMSVALECGFTSLTSFNKAFKQLMGASPTQVRNF